MLAAGFDLATGDDKFHALAFWEAGTVAMFGDVEIVADRRRLVVERRYFYQAHTEGCLFAQVEAFDDGLEKVAAARLSRKLRLAMKQLKQKRGSPNLLSDRSTHNFMPALVAAVACGSLRMVAWTCPAINAAWRVETPPAESAAIGLTPTFSKVSLALVWTKNRSD